LIEGQRKGKREERQKAVSKRGLKERFLPSGVRKKEKIEGLGNRCEEDQ